jgi:glucoamylase
MAPRAILSGLAVCAAALGFVVSSANAAESSLERWIDSQTERSLDRVYRAISVSDGAVGSVIASPSRKEPEYYYHWVRDSALVMREAWNYRDLDPKLARQTLKDYAIFSRKNQTTFNPSEAEFGRQIGEPKFEIDGSAYMKGWGRPQNDGPALRVLALLGLADDLMMGGDEDFVTKYLYRMEMPAQTVIKADLEYVAAYWEEPSVDLWEEIRGDHFYTRIAQWRALEEGGTFAKRMGDEKAGNYYHEQADRVLDSLNKFWSSSKGYIGATRNMRDRNDDPKPSNLDTAVILGVLHSGKSGAPFYVDDDRVIATMHEIELAFDYLYAVNRDRKNDEGTPMAPGLGRYPEDKYDGYRTDREGNPWFLSTHAAAQYLLLLRGELMRAGQLKITDISREFFEDLVKQDFSHTRKLREGDPTFEAVLQALQDRSDAYIRRSKFHTAEGGHQSEQFNRVHGHMQGARDLTWSYASFLSLRRIRDKYYE